MRTMIPILLAIGLFGSVASTQSGWDWRVVPTFPHYTGSAFGVDPVRKRLVRFGGQRGGQLSAETWEWDGKDWRLLRPKNSPPALASSALAFDPVRGTLILFGGVDRINWRGFAPRMVNQTWEWDGRNWSRLKPKAAPSPRFGCDPHMISDPKHGRILLYGGFIPGVLFVMPLPDLWEWKSGNWRLLQRQALPGAIGPGAMGFHRKTGKIFLFGGQTRAAFWKSDTWELNGTTWKWLGNAKPPWTSPKARNAWGFPEDPKTGELLLVGGWEDRNGHTYQPDDLWSWDGKRWKRQLTTMGARTGGFVNRTFAFRFGKDIHQLIEDDGPSGFSEIHRWTGKKWIRVSRVDHQPYPNGRLVYDDARRETLMIAGPSYSPKPTQLHVYRLVGERFVEIPTQIKPPYDGPFRVLYHPGLQRVVLFDDGVSTKKPAAWLWDGKKWTVQYHTGKFPKRFDTCYDPIRKTTLISALKSTWDWDGKNFQLLQTHAEPFFVTMAYDLERRRMVGHGIAKSYAKLSETWEWTGKAWQKMKTSAPTPQVVSPQLSYSPELGGIVLAGGYERLNGGPSFQETWLYDGKDWSKLPVSLLPMRKTKSAGMMQSMCYDAGRGRMLALYDTIYGQLRELSYRGLWANEPLLRPGDSSLLWAHYPKAADQYFILGLSLAQAPGIPARFDPGIGTRVLPLAFDSFFTWSLSIPMFTKLDKAGRGALPFRVPKIAGIPELDIWAAGFTLDPKRAFAIDQISNPTSLQIVR